MLPDDVLARQKLLEESVYEDATERLKHQAEVFDKLGLGDGSLNGSHLQGWMWDWHQKLQRRLKSEIENVLLKEETPCESFIAGSARVPLNIMYLISPDQEFHSFRTVPFPYLA